MDKLNKRGLLLTVIGTAILVLVVGAVSYAFFTTNADGKKVDASISTGIVSVRFTDNDNGINANLKFGGSVTKSFIIENTGTVDTTVKLYWKNLKNTYIQGSLTYELFYSETDGGDRIKIVDEIDVPVTNDNILTTMLADNVAVPVGSARYYYLVIKLNNLPGIDQTADLNASFSTEFGALDAGSSKYKILDVNLKADTIKQTVMFDSVRFESDSLIEEYYISIDGRDFEKISMKDTLPFNFCGAEAVTAKNVKISMYGVTVDGQQTDVYEFNYGGFVCWTNASISADASLSVYRSESDSVSMFIDKQSEDSSEPPDPTPSEEESIPEDLPPTTTGRGLRTN